MDPLASAEGSLAFSASGSRLALSKYLRTVDIGDGRLVAYSNVAFDPVILSAEEWRQVTGSRAMTTELYSRLIRVGLIATSAQDTQLMQQARLQLRASIESTQVLYLIASDGCNMACSYCPVPVRPSIHSLMPVSIFKAGFAEIVQASEAVEQRFILLYGGEPLENLPLLQYIATCYDKLSSSDSAGLEVLVCSNLTGLNEQTLSVLQQAPFKVVAGLDVPMEAPGLATRVRPDSSNTYTQTLDAARRLIARSVETYASTTLTPHAAEHVPNFLRMLQTYGFRGAGVNLLRGARGKQLLDRTNVSIEEYAATAATCFNRIAADASLRKFEYNTATRFDRLRNRINVELDCHAYGNQVVLYPDGTKGSCYLRGDRDYAPGVQNLSRLPLFNPSCDSCAARPACGGGCPWSTEELTGAGEDIDPIACQVTRAVNQEIVLRAVTP